MTLDELRAKADADLGATPLRTGVLLEWSFLNAEAHGRVTSAERYLAFLEANERDCTEARLRTYPPTADQVLAIHDLSVGLSGLDWARKDLAMAVSCLRATEHVMTLLDRRASKANVVPIRGVVDGGKAAVK